MAVTRMPRYCSFFWSSFKMYQPSSNFLMLHNKAVIKGSPVLPTIVCASPISETRWQTDQ